MRISVTDSELQVRSWRSDFSIPADRIDRVQIIGGLKYVPPFFLAKLFRRRPLIAFCMLGAGTKQVSLAARDIGFEHLLAWLAGRGWAVDPAIQRALSLPFVRIEVERF